MYENDAWPTSSLPAALSSEISANLIGLKKYVIIFLICDDFVVSKAEQSLTSSLAIFPVSTEIVLRTNDSEVRPDY